VNREPEWASIALTPIQADDLDQLNAWQNDAEIRDLIMGFRGPVRLETTAEWIRGVAEQNLKTRAVFAIRFRGALAGVAQLHMLDWVQRTALLGVYVGSPDARGARLGEAAVRLLLDYAFGGLDLHRVGLEVVASNAAAKRLYARLGFVREGVMRQAYQRGGVREDIEYHGMLRSEWTQTPPAVARRLTCPA